MSAESGDAESSGYDSDPQASGDSSAEVSQRNDSTADEANLSPQSDELTPAQVLTRASIDIRGRRPSIAEINRVVSSPETLNELLNDFFDDPGFADSVADLFSRAFRNRSDMYRGLDDDEGPGAPASYQQSAADESLMLIRHIVWNDLSFDEFLSADYTFANEDLASTWQMVGYDADVGGWQQVRYGDGRPPAGYLSLSSVFMRYLNDDFNYNRGRANAMSRILLCDDFLKRPVLFPRDLDLGDDDAIQNAIKTHVACTSCHDQLDPIASFFSVYTEPDLEQNEVRAQYRPENADQWQETTGQRPAFFGREGDDIGDLARFIREDPRYARCAVTRVYEGLLDRPVTRADDHDIAHHLESFENGGRTFRALYRSIMTDPLYRGVAQDQRPGTTAKMLSPELLQRVVTHVTGFHPKIGGVDLLRAGGEGESAGEAGGLRILGGGMSAFSGDYPSRTANVTRVLVQGRFADAAALYVVNTGGVKAEALVDDLESAPGSAGIERLFDVILKRAPTQDEIEDFTELYEDLRDEGAELAVAYAALISALLRDPEFIIY